MDVFKRVTPKAFFFLDLYKLLRLFFFLVLEEEGVAQKVQKRQ